ncbi:MAG: TonB-dependent receptor domain-containing protein [Odoribacter splanchnicus]
MDRNFFGKTGVTTDKPVSPYLTWEKTNQYDLGLDMDMFNYRLNMKLDYYYKYTSSLIYDIPIPGSLYTFGAQVENAMEISNEGLELELQADILRESAVSWRMKFNMARNWNRFEKSYSGKDVVDGDGTLLVAGRPLNGFTCGHTGGTAPDAGTSRTRLTDGDILQRCGDRWNQRRCQ